MKDQYQSFKLLSVIEEKIAWAFTKRGKFSLRAATRAIISNIRLRIKVSILNYIWSLPLLTRMKSDFQVYVILQISKTKLNKL